MFIVQPTQPRGEGKTITSGQGEGQVDSSYVGMFFVFCFLFFFYQIYLKDFKKEEGNWQRIKKKIK